MWSAVRRGAFRAAPAAAASSSFASSSGAAAASSSGRLFWDEYFRKVDENKDENFWGNLGIYKKSKLYGDPYVSKLC